MPEWVKKLVTLLINAYKKQVLLYNPDHPKYCCRQSRNRACEQICKEIHGKEHGVTVDDIKKKIHSLRNQFLREIRAIKVCRETNAKYHCKLWCFDQLEFLSEFCGRKKYPSKRADGTKSWTKEQTLKLIEELRKYPLLYDEDHPDYPSRSNRTEVLRKIAPKLKTIKPDVNLKDINKKIRLLKSQYYKEKRMMEASNPGEPKYTPKYWCYDSLLFFDEKQEDYQIAANSEPSEDDCTDMEMEDESFSERSEEPFEEVILKSVDHADETDTDESTQLRNELHSKCMQLVDHLTSEIRAKESAAVDSSIGSVQQSPHTFLGLLVESELAKVSEEIYEDAKWKIIHVLEEASKKNRDAKQQPVQINIPSTSRAATNTFRGGISVGKKFTTPVQTKTKVMKITNSIRK